MNWRRRGLAMAALHALSGCSPSNPCPPTTLKPWDGTYDAGAGFLGFFPDGGLSPGACGAICGTSINLFPCEADAGLLRCGEQCVGGRAPPGGIALGTAHTAGGWLARMAELEGAAVVAFEQLAAELGAHGFPRLAEASLQAALDEVRHATDLTRLALAFGASPTHRRHALAPIRSLEDVAIDNGGEGCGRELFGTLVNVHQAEHATDARVRATMARVAVDEAQHARMSLALADALRLRLTVAQRRRVREAQEQTVQAMVQEELPDAAARQLGLMDGRQLKRTAERVLTRVRI